MNRITWVVLLFFLLWWSEAVNASVDSLYNEARELAHNGKYSEALVVLDTVFHMDTANVDALLLKGMVFLWQKRYSEAATILLQVTHNTPDYRDAWVALIKAQLWGDDLAEACTTCGVAEKMFGGDSTIASLQKTACRESTEEKTDNSGKSDRSVDIFAGIGGTLFENEYGRSPWAQLTGGVDLKIKRWGIMAGINAERRKYDASPLYAAEIEVAPRFVVFPKGMATLRLSYSPYSLFDTLYACYSIKPELTVGLPGKIELDGAARCAWYGENFSPYYSIGLGKYLKNYLLSSRIFIATVDGDAYYSGVGTLRRFAKRNELGHMQAGIALGRTPYDAGTFTKSGYFNFLEGQIGGRIPVTESVTMEPLLLIAGEQLVRIIDLNNDGIADKRAEEIRLRLQCLVKIHLIKE